MELNTSLHGTVWELKIKTKQDQSTHLSQRGSLLLCNQEEEITFSLRCCFSICRESIFFLEEQFQHEASRGGTI